MWIVISNMQSVNLHGKMLNRFLIRTIQNIPFAPFIPPENENPYLCRHFANHGLSISST